MDPKSIRGVARGAQAGNAAAEIHESPDGRGRWRRYDAREYGDLHMQTLTLGGRLSRRAFVGTVAGLGASVGSLALLSGCGLMPAQPRGVPRVAFVWSAPRDATVDRERDAFVTGLQAHGYIEGVNIGVDWRYSSSETGADLPSLMTELVVGEPDTLLRAGTPATQAAQQATSTIPIVGCMLPIRWPPGW